MVNMGTNVDLKAGLSIEKLLDRVNAQATTNEDFEVKLRDVDFMSNGCLRVERQLYGFTPHSLQQFCAKIKVPVDFLRRSPKTGDASQKALVEHWKEEVEDKRILIRTKRHEEKDKDTGAVGRVRAVLSDRYSIFDNAALLEAFQPLVSKHNMTVQTTSYSDNEMHIRVVNPELYSIGNHPVTKEPDLHKYGFHLLNSEIGLRNIVGDMFFLRQVCKNGLVVPAGGEHLFFASHGRKLSASEIKNQLQAAIERLQLEQETVKEQLQAAADGVLTVSAGQMEIRRLMREGGAPNDVVDATVETFTNTNDFSRFGVVQAITQNARGLSMPRRFDVESRAGSYLVAA